MTMTAASRAVATGTGFRAGRIGGLAVALGVGAAVATGLASEASAAPSDTSAAASETAASSDTSAKRASSSSRAVNRGSSAEGREDWGPSAVAREDRGARVAAAAAARTSTAVARAAAAEPALARAVVTVPAAVTPAAQSPRRVPVVASVAPVAPAAATNPVAGFLEGVRNIFCDPRGRRITFLKGTHFAIPPSFGFFIRKVSGTGTFTSDSVYDLGDVDQYDWNKFTGIAFTPLEPDRDSAMVGWRYNLTSQEFEIAPFYNVDKARILPTPADIISVPADQTFEYLVDYTGVTLTYGDTTVFKPYPEGLTPRVWTASRVSGWFGGNEVAPRTLSYFLRINWFL